MPHIGFPELILILVIALIVFGPGKLPSVGAAVGKAFHEFRKASRELTKDPVQESIESPAKAAPMGESEPGQPKN